MTDTIITIQNLCKSYGTTQAIKSLSLTINRGEMFCIVGPDGAGKTTLMRIMCGVIRATSGEIETLGMRIPAQIKSIRSQIGYLSQKFSLYGDLSIDENIEFFAEIHKVKDYRPRREELLKITRLEPFRKRLAERLSGGMKQKLALACTLIHKPEIIYLDEPTTGVDPVSRRDFWKILSDLLTQGVSIVMNTPYMDEAERSSRTALMHLGNFIAVGTPRELREKLNLDILEIQTPDIRKDSKILKALPSVSDAQTFGDRINILCRDCSMFDKDLKESGIQILSIRQVQPSLENLFIDMIKKHNENQDEKY